MAARLCGEAKDKQILIAPRVLSKVEAHIEVEPAGDLVLKGFQRPVPAYNILGISRAGSGQFTSTNRNAASVPGSLTLGHD
jgi:class 3 adenylate cyclase